MRTPINRAPLRLLGADTPSDGPGHFDSEASPRYLAVVDALNELNRGDPRDAEAAAAEVLQHDRYAALEQGFGTPTWFSGCALRALGRARGHDCWSESLAPGYGRCLPPGTDHPRLLRRGGKTVGLLLQPYHVSWTALQGLVAYCTRHRLEARFVGDGSYHFPSRTVAIVITPRTASGHHPDDED